MQCACSNRTGTKQINLIKIRSPHLLPIFVRRVGRSNKTPLRVASGVNMNVLKLTNQRYFYKLMKKIDKHVHFQKHPIDSEWLTKNVCAHVCRFKKWNNKKMQSAASDTPKKEVHKKQYLCNVWPFLHINRNNSQTWTEVNEWKTLAEN